MEEMEEIIAETKRKEAGGANVKDGNATATKGLTGETGAGKRCKFQGTDCEPLLLPDPKQAGRKLRQPAWGSEVRAPAPSDSSAVSKAQKTIQS